jgi:hypothetical protein
MIRNIIAVVVGLISAIGIFLIAESINLKLHPTPENIDFKDANAVKSYYLNQPLPFWLLVLAGWIVGSFVCGLLIKIISKTSNNRLPMIAGSILTLSAVANFLSFPHPTWFIVIGLVVFLPCTFFGHYLFKIK